LPICSAYHVARMGIADRLAKMAVDFACYLFLLKPMGMTEGEPATKHLLPQWTAAWPHCDYKGIVFAWDQLRMLSPPIPEL